MSAPAPNPKLLHVCGYPSSGTTLLRAILNSHPDVCLKNEIPLLMRALENSPREMDVKTTLGVLERLKKQDIYKNFNNLDAFKLELEELASIDNPEVFTLEQIYARCLDEDSFVYYGNKTPQYTELMPALLNVFPQTKIIMITRDIRDVALSYRNKWGKDMFLCAQKWQTRHMFGANVIDQLPEGQGYILRYEDILLNPDETISKVCDFLNIDYIPQMLQYDRFDKDPGKSKSPMNSRSIDAKKLNGWDGKLSSNEVQRIEEISFDAMKRFGYKPAFAKVGKKIDALSIYSAQFRDILALFFVGNRYAKINRVSYIVKFLKNSFGRLLTNR